MGPSVEKRLFLDFEQETPNGQLNHFIESTAEKFQKILKSYAAFNILFWSLIGLEIFYLVFHLTFLIQTFILATHLALIFATIFSYFTLRLYFQTKKNDRFYAVKDEFYQSVKDHINYQAGVPEHHLMIASVCCKVATLLQDKEYVIYKAPSWLDFLSSLLEKFSCWSHWQDILFIKELLLKGSVQEHISLVQLEPTNLEVHVGLANAYVILSGLYVDPRTIEGLDDEQWVPANKYNEVTKAKFRAAAEKAIEEFKILSDYAPNDPWVHAQLAFSYRDLQMPLEEIKQYEIILTLCPEDKETLFKLGKLYFEQGWNAKGLQVYETLKKSNYKKAESLIQYYGAQNSR